MTHLIRTMTDPGEISTARYDAHEDFLSEMDSHPRRAEKVSDALLARWYGKSSVERDRMTKILNEYGPAVSTRLERR